jgi:hypothetical protein
VEKSKTKTNKRTLQIFSSSSSIAALVAAAGAAIHTKM